jgi:hypothetical protein
MKAKPKHWLLDYWECQFKNVKQQVFWPICCCNGVVQIGKRRPLVVLIVVIYNVYCGILVTRHPPLLKTIAWGLFNLKPSDGHVRSKEKSISCMKRPKILIVGCNS